MTTFYRSHRALGREVARAIIANGSDLVILQTAPHRQEVAPAHMLMPVSDAELAFEVQVYLIEAIEKARFLGFDNDALQIAFAAALHTS